MQNSPDLRTDQPSDYSELLEELENSLIGPLPGQCYVSETAEQ
jgi:hypothetical protein